jgi:hypothetical protein
MKARVWFQAQGQRMRSRGFNWHEAKVLIGLYSLPRWAQQAVARGHLNQTYGVGEVRSQVSGGQVLLDGNEP